MFSFVVKALLPDHIVGDSFVFRASFLQVRGAKTIVLREAGTGSERVTTVKMSFQLGGRTCLCHSTNWSLKIIDITS